MRRTALPKLLLTPSCRIFLLTNFAMDDAMVCIHRILGLVMMLTGWIERGLCFVASKEVLCPGYVYSGISAHGFRTGSQW